MMRYSLKIDIETAAALFTDRVGICIGCGSMTHPVANDAAGKPCEVCGKTLLVGATLAFELGAFQVEDTVQ